MVDDWYTFEDAHLQKAYKMSTWRNADAKLQAANVHAVDQFIAGRLFEPVGIAAPLATGATYLPKFKTTQYVPGSWEEILYFQTAFNIYPAMGVCSTVEASPNVHTITLRTTQTPVNQGRHFERENAVDAESERIDILGMLLNHMHIECSEASPTAIQQNKWACAFTKNSSTDDITAASLTDEYFEWKHFSFPTFTYNSETIEAEVVGWAFDVVNTLHFTGLDTNGRYSIGRYIPLTQITTTLEIIPKGKNAFELIRDELPYATDLDLTVLAARTANSDEVKWTHDKMYCQPFTITTEKTGGKYERYLLVLSQMDTGSLTVVAKDDYNNNYYENP